MDLDEFRALILRTSANNEDSEVVSRATECPQLNFHAVDSLLICMNGRSHFAYLLRHSLRQLDGMLLLEATILLATTRMRCCRR